MVAAAVVVAAVVAAAAVVVAAVAAAVAAAAGCGGGKQECLEPAVEAAAAAAVVAAAVAAVVAAAPGPWRLPAHQLGRWTWVVRRAGADRSPGYLASWCAVQDKHTTYTKPMVSWQVATRRHPCTLTFC